MYLFFILEKEKEQEGLEASGYVHMYVLCLYARVRGIDGDKYNWLFFNLMLKIIDPSD